MCSRVQTHNPNFVVEELRRLADIIDKNPVVINAYSCTQTEAGDFQISVDVTLATWQSRSVTGTEVTP
jgi:hypothetical protein